MKINVTGTYFKRDKGSPN